MKMSPYGLVGRVPHAARKAARDQISLSQIEGLVGQMPNCEYRQYLSSVIEEVKAIR